MKKQGIIVLLFILVLGGGIFYFVNKTQKAKEEEEKRINSIKSGWYIEVANEYLNVREEANSHSELIQKINEGEVYKALDFIDTDELYFWYKIELNDDLTGYVANPRSTNNSVLVDHNNPNDIAYPKLSFEDNEYYVRSIDDINYKHLTLWDDKEGYKVTHQVYHEYVDCLRGSYSCEPKDQYWIKYTITDASGKSTSKTQKIIFEIRPAESRVLSFDEFYN